MGGYGCKVSPDSEEWRNAYAFFSRIKTKTSSRQCVMYVGVCTWFWNMSILFGLRHWHGGMSFISTVWLQPHFTTTHIWSGNNPYRISASVCTEIKKCDYNHTCHFGQIGSTSKKLLNKLWFLISLTVLQHLKQKVFDHSQKISIFFLL